MTFRKQLMYSVLLAVGLSGPAAAEDEGVRTGVVQEVEPSAGIVVIDDQRYRYEGKSVQPPPGVSAESEQYRRRPFERGLIVRFTVAPGNPPAIQEAWSID
ncbi:MAG: hypothetical protein U5K33_02275 [Halofilum sp. (in: g-proteobacteria)]|nr:hypothetical protein [Halofilum sp. (in: g-proteobacteria)]